MGQPGVLRDSLNGFEKELREFGEGVKRRRTKERSLLKSTNGSKASSTPKKGTRSKYLTKNESKENIKEGLK